jgi:polyisoprenoid-binding protein YceI
MKRILLPIAAALFIISCQDAPKADKAETAEKQTAATATGTAFKIDTVSSVVGWLGTKPVGQHNGTLKINNGEFTLANGEIAAGKFIIDINSLTDVDMKSGDGKEKLEGHLKSADFFDVAKYPNATFEITKVEALQNDSTATHRISGNLTLKDSTKNVTFPAKITVAENTINASANFNIDRTQWGMHYGNDKSLGDKFVRPEVNLQLKIVANKS